MTEETGSLHDDLMAAFDAPEPTPEAPPAAVPDAVAVPDAPVGETEAQREERVRDEKGRFAKKVETPAGTPEVEAQPEKVPEVAAAPPVPVVEPPPPIKPPQAWKPTLREQFATLPPDIQQEVLRREKDITTALQESSDARQAAQKFRELTTPYEHMFRAEGVDAHRAIQNLLQTTAALSSGAPHTRAQIVANIVRTYLPGREGLELLDQVLSGQPMTQSVASYTPQRDPRVDDLLAQVEAAKAQQAQTLQQKAKAAMEEVSGLEFFEDVREDMADLLDLAAKRGIAKTPKQAYDQAVSLHPEVSKVLKQREAARAAVTPTVATQRARAAASSVRSTPAGSVGKEVPRSLREELEAAFDNGGT
jgi:hypothetical protein